jgi:hypothetical protein
MNSGAGTGAFQVEIVRTWGAAVLRPYTSALQAQPMALNFSGSIL